VGNDTQNAAILDSLQRGNEICQVIPDDVPFSGVIDALHTFGCMRLAARIKDIRTQVGDTRNADGTFTKIATFFHAANGKRWATYKWVGQLHL